MRPNRFLAASVAALFLLVACGSDDDSAQPGEGDDPTTTVASAAPDAPGADAFPVTIENCGIETTYEAAPEAAVVIYQHPTEVMLALGLEGSMVGTAYMDSAIREDLVEAYETVPVLAEEAPSREQVLAAEPDIIVAGWSSAFADTSAGSRESLAELDIESWLEPSSCPEFSERPTLDLVRAGITEIGAIFGVPDRAVELIEAIEAPIDETAERLSDVEPVEVFVYDSGTDQAMTTGGFENTTLLVSLAGGRNIFEDIDDTWVDVNWEDVVDRDPDVVLILDYGSTTADEKRQLLKGHAVASTLRAVQEDRIVVTELTDMVPGIRNGDVVAAMAEGFHPDL